MTWFRAYYYAQAVVTKVSDYPKKWIPIIGITPVSQGRLAGWGRQGGHQF